MDDPAAVDKLLDPRLRVIQIIVGALIAGVLVFTGFVLVRGPDNQAPIPNGQAPILSYAAFGVFAAALLIWAIVPNGLAGREVAKIATGTWTAPTGQTISPDAFGTDLAKLFAVLQTKTIIAGALLEGPAFMADGAYMIERQLPTLGVVACAVLLMLITFPTRKRVQQWLEKQQKYIDESRQFGESSKS
jgi:hypothetical protein